MLTCGPTRRSGHRTARSVLSRRLAEPATARPVQRALFGIAEQTGDLLQMQSRHREVTRRMRSALDVDGVRDGRARVVIGWEAKALDVLSRLTGLGYQRVRANAVRRFFPSANKR